MIYFLTKYKTFSKRTFYTALHVYNIAINSKTLLRENRSFFNRKPSLKFKGFNGTYRKEQK